MKKIKKINIWICCSLSITFLILLIFNVAGNSKGYILVEYKDAYDKYGYDSYNTYLKNEISEIWGRKFLAAVKKNNSGSIVACLREEEYKVLFLFWNADTGVIKITPDDAEMLNATDLNDHNEVTGFYYTKNRKRRLFLWSPESGLQDIETLGSSVSGEITINNKHQISGNSRNLGNKERAFLWSKEEGIIGLGTFGGEKSNAVNINNNGAIIGDAQDENGIDHAFFWTKDTGMTRIAPSMSISSIAKSVNDRNEVIGQYTGKDNSPHAFYWSEKTGPRELSIKETKIIDIEYIDENGRIFAQVEIPHSEFYLWFRKIFFGNTDGPNTKELVIIFDEQK